MSYINVGQSNFNSEVIASDKRVLLDFWAPRCSHCRIIAPAVENIASENEDIKVAKINIDEEPELAVQFGIRSIPTLVVMDGGEIVTRSVGIKNKKAILKMLEE